MGTIAEKLKYLNETKAEIKNALETPYNVMRDYPELIKKYIDNQPTKVVTDGICGNAVDVPVKAIEINGNIRQETTEGKNKFNLNYIEQSTSKVVTDTGVNLINCWGTQTFNNEKVLKTFKPNTTYTMKAKAKVVSRPSIQGVHQTSTLILYRAGSSALGLVSVDLIKMKDKETIALNTEKEYVTTFTTPADLSEVRLLSYSFYGNNDGSTTYVPSGEIDLTDIMLVEGIYTIDDFPSYEPYTGEIPSPSPDYPSEITNVGGYDNIFNKNNIINGSYVSDGNGAFIGNNTSKRTDYIEIQASSYYYIYSDKLTGNWGAWYDKDKKFISGITLGSKNEGVVNSPANAKYIVFTVSYRGNLTDYSKIKINETAIKIKQSGKNLFDKDSQDMFLKGLTPDNIGKIVVSPTNTSTSNYLVTIIIPCLPDSTYIISRYVEGKTYLVYESSKKDLKVGDNVTFLKKNDNTGIINEKITTGTNAKYLLVKIYNTYATEPNTYNDLISSVQIEKGSTATPYEPYHEPIITPINLQGNILSKVGDVKDILKVNRNGEVEIKKNIEKIVLTGREKLVQKSSSTTRTYWGIDFSNYGIYQYNDPTKVCDVLTTKFKSRPQQGTFLPGQVALATNSKNMYFVLEPDTTEEQARAILKDMPVYFRLAEPQTIKLLSMSLIELWQGTNIFKLITNLDTDFEVEYVVDKDSVTKEEE